MKERDIPLWISQFTTESGLRAAISSFRFSATLPDGRLNRTVHAEESSRRRFELSFYTNRVSTYTPCSFTVTRRFMFRRTSPRGLRTSINPVVVYPADNVTFLRRGGPGHLSRRTNPSVTIDTRPGILFQIGSISRCRYGFAKSSRQRPPFSFY